MNVSVNLSVPKDTKRKDIADKLKPVLPDKFKLKSIKMPLKQGAGRRRGNAWEVKFCKELSLWWTLGSDDSIFKRAGATHSVEDGHIYGDVYAIKPEGFQLTDNVAIELKVVKETRVETANLLCGNSKMFQEFWEQAVRQAAMGKRHPILVVKMDRYCTLVFNLLDTVGQVRLLPKGRLVPVCTLDDWFNLDIDEFAECEVFKQFLSRIR